MVWGYLPHAVWLSHITFPRDEYLAPIPEAERHDLILAYHAQLNSADEETRLTAAKAWAKWEQVLTSSTPLKANSKV